MRRWRISPLWRRSLLLAVLLALAGTAWVVISGKGATSSPVANLTHLALLVPDGLPDDDAGLQA